MQTFLPLPDFTDSARALDRRRLGKQRVETLQVLRGLVVPGYGWRHHPAVKMWVGYEEALVRYGLEVCTVWQATGAADTCALKLVDEYQGAAVRSQAELAAAGELPPWLGDDAVHRSHRSALVRKDPAHYAALFSDVPPDLPYVWPPSDR
ncbi:MSMEG_6728 family protein [Amycolatopsis solani]|uniref:MSMEG_6728 family protein n=1 Tax=Amycolatopsis solani TaxID=3028615 RepID=UPI0025B25A74|nr:MSMEG_6728 family protein [Amycolatopsis sp. MEP2-6]